MAYLPANDKAGLLIGNYLTYATGPSKCSAYICHGSKYIDMAKVWCCFTQLFLPMVGEKLSDAR